MSNATNPVPITRQDAVRRLIELAIWLFFHGGDPLGTQLLAGAVSRQTYDICEHIDRVSFRKAVVNTHHEHGLDALPQILNAYDYLRHADRKPFETLDSCGLADNVPTLLLACLDYMTAFQQGSLAVSLYLQWFAALEPEYLGELVKPLPDDLLSIPPEQQLAIGRMYYDEFVKDGLLSPPVSDLPFSDRS